MSNHYRTQNSSNELDSANITIAKHRAIRRRYDISEINLVIMGFKGDHIFEQIRASGSLYEQDLLNAISRGLPDTPTAVVDVGANIGNHSLYFASVFKCPVLAIEPSPITASVLRKNISKNGLDNQIQVVQNGASDNRRSIFLHSPESHNLGMARLEEAALSDADCRVSVLPLDEIIANWRLANDIAHVDLIKIDVEGHEERVLAGAKTTLRSFEPTLLIEVAQEEALSRIESVLAPMGYRTIGPFCATPTYVFAKRWRNPQLLYRVARYVHKQVRLDHGKIARCLTIKTEGDILVTALLRDGYTLTGPIAARGIVARAKRGIRAAFGW